MKLLTRIEYLVWMIQRSSGRILPSHIIATKFIMVTVILSRPTGTTAVNCAINSVVSANLSGNMVIIEDMNCKIDIIEDKENIK